MDLDEKFFCGSATATDAEKIEAVSALLEIFVAGGGAEESAEDGG